MRPLALLILLLLFVQTIQAQENTRYELRHIQLEEAMSQHDFAMSYNVCWEQVHQYLYHREVFTIPADIDLYFPPDMLPCYNEAGQRLIFFENGEALDQPYYSDMRVYVIEDETIESLTRIVNVCIEDIVLQNEHFLSYDSVNFSREAPVNLHPFVAGQELFIPETPPCYDEQGRKLAYTPEGAIPLEDTLYFFVRYYYYSGFEDLSYLYNICPENILAANYWDNWPLSGNPAIRGLVIPEDVPACYRVYRDIVNTPEDIALRYNICPAQVYSTRNYNGYDGSFTYNHYIRHDIINQGCEEALPIVSPTNSFTITTYSDLLSDLSRRYNVCATDIMAANGSNRPGYEQSYNIPQTLPCYDANGYKLIYLPDGSTSIHPLPLVVHDGGALRTLAWQQNICEAAILAVNPQLNFGDELSWQDIYVPHFMQSPLYAAEFKGIELAYGTEVFLPQNPAPCYEFHPAESREEALALAQNMNICIEQLLTWSSWQNEQRGFMIPYEQERERCYDENGRRLSFYDENGRQRSEPIRLANEIYRVPYAMSAYELSRSLNICVNDLTALNNVLLRIVPYENLEIFLPEAAPCYDEVTGQQLIYTDANGAPLAEPQLSEYLVHHVDENDSWGTIGKLYNVCHNRLLDFNVDFLPNVWTNNFFGVPERIADPRGILVTGAYVRIPTDRPACFGYTEEQNYQLRYACYDEAIDMTQENPDAVINPDGNHCYNIQDPATVIWHNGDRYLYQEREGYLFTNDFMAWCFGVSESDIIAEAENGIVYIWPYAELLVRNPTQPCYVREYDGQENVHWVTRGETLRDIAWRYGKLPQWIAEANHLNDPDLIWEYQRLVIPEGINLWDVYYAFCAILGIGSLAILTRFLLKRRALASTKKKRQ